MEMIKKHLNRPKMVLFRLESKFIKSDSEKICIATKNLTIST
jgi:hypothetical protein